MTQHKLARYWPHAGIVVGGGLNAAGLIWSKSDLIGTGSNILAFCAWYLGRRKSSE